MHFASTLAAAGTLRLFGAALAAAVAIPAELRPRGGDASVKFFAHTSCSFKGGPRHELYKDICQPLAGDSHGLKITDHGAGCYINKYADGNCQQFAYKLDQIDRCYDVGDDWGSIKVVCGGSTSKLSSNLAKAGHGHRKQGPP